MQLAQALRRHANTLRQQGHCQIKVINRGDEQLLPAVLQQQILSLCSEALANIAKHAQAQHARVELWWALDTLTVIIEDDGVGFDLHTPPVSNSFGIRIMQDRAVQMAGQLEIQSQHLVGTKLTLHVPLSLG
ncbi:MAG: ATP-binding protein [Caldilineaceae bacterium]